MTAAKKSKLKIFCVVREENFKIREQITKVNSKFQKFTSRFMKLVK